MDGCILRSVAFVSNSIMQLKQDLGFMKEGGGKPESGSFALLTLWITLSRVSSNGSSSNCLIDKVILDFSLQFVHLLWN